MTRIVYNIFILLFRIGIRISSLWNSKARRWLSGRKNIFRELKSKLSDQDAAVTWVHCSSLGEFEQGRPVMEKIKSRYPDSKILLTFFSPSGYDIRKDYKGADWVFYLPMDSAKNAERFLDIIKPSLVIFVKYDYWYYYLAECKKRNIPLLMISAIFRKDQVFFKWYGGLHRKMLQCFTNFFVQDEESAKLLRSVKIDNVTIAGDTRFDRVAEIAENFKPIEIVDRFCKGSDVLVAGSTWPADEKILKEATQDIPELKLVIAPHEIHSENLSYLKELFPNSVLYSQLNNSILQSPDLNCLIIDNIGMLSNLYRYATITYIGGGFTNGIHNVLEAAVYGKPVLFGPNYNKYLEAIMLIESGGAIEIKNKNEFPGLLKKMLTDKMELESRSKRSFEFVQNNKGATEKITGYIQENRLLTR